MSLLTPGIFVEVDTSRAVQGVSALPHETLICGQMTADGNGVEGTAYAVASGAQADALFGSTSQIAQMVRAYKAVDSLTPVWAIALADATGTNATGDIEFAGTATEAGSISFYCGGRRVNVAVPVGMTAAELETAAVAAFALQTDLPAVVTADGGGTGIVFTAVHDGVIGNQILIGHSLLADERVPAGLTLTVTGMSSGATNPDYDDVVSAMSEDQYNTVVCGIVDATENAKLITELESRFNALRAIEGSMFISSYGSQAALTSLVNSYNSAMLVLIGAEASALLPLPWEMAARCAALDALQAKTDPSRATGGQLIPGIFGAHRSARFTRAERDTLLSDGVSTVVAQRDGRVVLERLVTTYQTNALSVPDTSLQDQQTLRLLSAIRHSARVRIATRFARFKLVGDETVIPPGQPMTNPRGVKAELVALGNEWLGLGWIENIDQYIEELYVERDESDPNRINAVLPPDFVNNLLVTAMKVSYRK